MLYGTWQGSFSAYSGAFSISFLGSILNIYFAYYLQLRPMIMFPRGKRKNIFLPESLRSFLLPNPISRPKQYPHPSSNVYAAWPSTYLPSSSHWVNCLFSQTLWWMKPCEQLGWARSLSSGVMISLACWCFEALSWPSGNITATLHFSCNISPSFILCNFCSILFISLFLSLLTFLWTSTSSIWENARKGYFSHCPLCLERIHRQRYF